MSILIVDDSKVIQVLLSTTLKKAGYVDLLCVSSAQEAFNFLGIDNQERMRTVVKGVDLILMDIVMPVIDGIEACRAIKENEFMADIPIVMVTAKDESEVLQLAFSAGAVDYIVKPVKKQELLARVRSVLKLKHEMDRRKSRERELLEVTRQLEEANKTLQRFSYLDGLTGVSNRRFFDDTLLKEWRRAQREKQSIGFIMIDIDFFKAYNDFYGHQGGDECLKRVARAINTVPKRPTDFVARYGGEEFAVVLPNTDIEGVMVVAEQMLNDVRNLAIVHERSKVADRVTISLGIAACIPPKGKGFEQLIKEADAALYSAKADGRDRFKSS
ncbi:MAG: hypothetical protein A2511_08265 [Deltaproteobacteria bacterium RIFOXYD12_FULL_50_9]|nr:MAG: hypothetical protein A2511_08265 [Deltaproteobacteria bacterium RIFOXYD12_FULL_50_9]